MPSLGEHPSSSIVKMLNIGESKSGKTGALASLAKSGYRLWILDFDKGVDILARYLQGDPPALARVTYESLSDPIHMVGGIPQVKIASAWKEAGNVLKRWNADKFNAEDVIVIDTLTTASEAAFRQAIQLGGRLNQRAQLQDYGWMADSVSTFIQMLADPSFACNLIVNSHVRFLGGGDGDAMPLRGLPNALGQQIPSTVARYFNTVVLTHTVGSGPATRRQISTKPQGVVQVATSNPLGVKDAYPLEDGLASLFSDITGKTAKGVAPASASSPARA